MTACEKTRTMMDTVGGSDALSGNERRHLDAHLHECPACRTYAAEADSLLALLAAMPRVDAPPDFDFRLRARIATVKAQRNSFWGSLAALWSRPVGWNRVGATMATVALVAGMAALYATHSRSTLNAPDMAIRAGSQVTQPAASPATVPPAASIAPPAALSANSSANSSGNNVIRNDHTDLAVAGTGARGVSPRGSRFAATNVSREIAATGADLEISGLQGTRVVVESRGARPVVTIPQVTYGAQRAVIRQNASVAEGSAVQTVF